MASTADIKLHFEGVLEKAGRRFFEVSVTSFESVVAVNDSCVSRFSRPTAIRIPANNEALYCVAQYLAEFWVSRGDRWYFDWHHKRF